MLDGRIRGSAVTEKMKARALVRDNVRRRIEFSSKKPAAVRDNAVRSGFDCDGDLQFGADGLSIDRVVNLSCDKD